MKRFVHFRPTVAVVASVLFLAAAPASAALVLLDNTAQGTGTLDTSGVSANGNNQVAVVFSTTADLDLTAATFGMLREGGGSFNASGLIRLFAVNAQNNPTGSALATLSTPSVTFTGTPTYYTFALAGMSIAAGNSYALVASGFDGGSSGSRWVTRSPASAPAGANGVGYVGFRLSFNSGTSWTSSATLPAIYLQGEPPAPVPAPSALVLVGTALAGLLGTRRRRPACAVASANGA